MEGNFWENNIAGAISNRPMKKYFMSMKLVDLKIQFLLQPFHYVENNGATIVMHKRSEHPFFKAGQMQCGKLFTAFEPVFVHRTFIICKKMAGYGVEQHHAIASFFNILLVETIPFHLEVPCQVFRFGFIDVYHEALAAVTTRGAINLRCDFLVKLGHKLVYLDCVVGAEKRPELIVFVLLLHRSMSDIVEVFMEADGIQGAKTNWYLRL
jgi:hypothetical protein